MTNPPAARPLKRIVLGLTGGIAAYKAAELTRPGLRRLAQWIVAPSVQAGFRVGAKFESSQRGEGEFGSSATR